ncbi:MAG: division plane positioning ATPase MipZ [Methylocella sp.]
MRTILFTTQKGACGKSTLASCRAIAAQEAGERVSVFDMDPKKSLVRWAAKRKDGARPIPRVELALPLSIRQRLRIEASCRW